MSRPVPKKMVLEYEDGSRTSAPFQELPETLQREILRQPCFSTHRPYPEKEKYVLIEWDDGWKEVIQVDECLTEINRYYVITRPEEVGRLSLKSSGEYPELLEIIRKPMNLKKITFSGTHEITLDKSIREGKKTDHLFACNRKGDSLSKLKESLRKALEDEGVSLEALKSKDQNQLRDLFGRMKRTLDIKAGVREQDVFDFLAFLCHTSH
jgi:hypothetical protein